MPGGGIFASDHKSPKRTVILAACSECRVKKLKAIHHLTLKKISLNCNSAAESGLAAGGASKRIENVHTIPAKVKLAL
jgi:hypothetical protein